jgi:formylglycine-generating enzyme required for sulfatase activity
MNPFANRRLTPAWALLFLTLASQPALAADKGMLRIVTEPGDAQIFIDGKRKGNSPTEAGQSFAVKLNEGEHVVQAVKPGTDINEHYAEKKVFVADESMQTLNLKLEQRVSQTLKKALKEKYAGQIPVPELVSLPAGRFRMGCLGSDKECGDDEKPVRKLSVAAFELGKTEVTFDQWDACFALGGCEHYPSDEGWGRGNRPVINVSWNDVQQYLAWLKKETGQTWRLPSEAEWEYAARAGTETVYSWGDAIGKNRANCDGCGSQWDNKQTAPVGSFAANPWGLSDMHGNV